MGLNITGSVKGVLITMVLIGFNYFVMPYLFPDLHHQGIYFSVVTTFANVLAIILSWIYFSHTGCYEDEGNLIATYGYKIFGANAVHFFFFITRVAGNVTMIILFFTFPGILGITIPYLFNLKIFLLSYSIGNAMYVYEAINNGISVGNGIDYKCNSRSLMCNVIDDPFFCDFHNE